MATLQNTIGDLNRNSSLHYFGAIPDVASAVAYAAKMKMIVGVTTAFGTFADNMTAPGPGGAANNLCLGLYNKGEEYPGTNLPDHFYAHTNQAGGTSTRINIFSGSIYLMQPDHTVSTPYQDPRGFSATSWKDWKSKDVWQVVDDENAKYPSAPTLPFNVGYLDSLSATHGIGNTNPVSWQDGHTYSATEFHALVYPIGDATKNQEKIAPRYTFGNGLHNGYQGWDGGTGNTSDLPSHLEGVVAENWMRDNGGSMTAFRSDTDWRKEVECIEDIWATTGTYVWVVVNINNPTAGGSGFTPVSTTPAQVDQWLQYCAASYMIGSNGHGFFEFVEATSIKPWNDNRPVFNISLGSALDTHTGAGTAHLYQQAGGEYRRRFTNGVAYVNANHGSSITITPDRTYNYLDGTPVGASFVLANNHGIILVLAGSGGGGGGGGSLQNYYTDNFGRVVAAGSLGTADTGQTYTLAGTASDYRDDGDRAVINAPLTTSRRITPSGVSVQDTELRVQIGESEVPVGGNQTVYLWARESGGDTAYRLQLKWAPGGAFTYTLQKIVAGVTTALAGPTTATWTPALGDILEGVLRVEQINPTIVSGKVWRANKDIEPATFDLVANDSETTLQVAGQIDISAFVETGNTNAPLNFFVYYAQGDEIVTVAPPPTVPTIAIVAPANGDTFTIPAGQTLTQFVVSAAVVPGDGTITSVTCQVNTNTANNMTNAGGTWNRTLNLGTGDKVITCVVTDSNGLTATDTITVTVALDVTAPTPIPPAVTTPITDLQWTIVHLDHNGNKLGEAIGQDLRFGKYLGNAGFVSYSLQKSQAMAKPDIEPNAVDYGIILDGVLLAAGELTDIERDSDADMVDFAGQDWQGYLSNLVIPWNPLNPKNFYMQGADLTDIVEGLVDFVLSKYANTIDIITNNDNSGIFQTQHFLASDLADLTSMIDTLSTQARGFDWEITPDKVLLLYFPLKTGTSTFVCDESNIIQIHHGKQGVRASKLYGRGSGSGTSQLLSIQSDDVIAGVYRDRVTAVDYTVTSQHQLDLVTQRDLQNRYGKQLLNFWVTVQPPRGYNIWRDVEPGYTITVRFDDGNILVDGSFRVIGMETYINPQGDAQVTFSFSEDTTIA